MTYSQVSDMLLGGIPTPADASNYVQDAADEIDSKLAFRYQTPIVVDGTGDTRATQLLLKRISNYLATGRCILAKASPTENSQLHAYGWSLIQEAEASLNSLVTGDFVLPGATPIITDEVAVSGPILSNLDAASNVESFYGFVTTDPYTAPPLAGTLFPAGYSRLPYTG